MAKKAINFFEDYEDSQSLQRKVKNQVDSVVKHYGLKDFIGDIRVDILHSPEAAGIEVRLLLDSKQVGIKSAYSHGAVLATTDTSFYNSIEQQARKLLNDTIVHKLEKSPYFKRKLLQFEQDEVEYKSTIRELQAANSVLQQEVANLREQLNAKKDEVYERTKSFKERIKGDSTF
jgi:hypothetical protein